MMTNTCTVCGAEESLDALLLRMIDDDDVRHLVAELVCFSLPLGGQVIRYLRLHKPAQQRLRMRRVAALLGELLPDMRRGAITRKGRDWPAGGELWRAALDAVFDACDKGTLHLPLDGNAYLYEVVMRLADRAEGERERADQGALRRSPPPAAAPQPTAGVPTSAAAALDAVRQRIAERAVTAPPPRLPGEDAAA